MIALDIVALKCQNSLYVANIKRARRHALLLRFNFLYTFTNFCHTCISIFACIAAGSFQVCCSVSMPLVQVRWENDESGYNANKEGLKWTSVSASLLWSKRWSNQCPQRDYDSVPHRHSFFLRIPCFLLRCMLCIPGLATRMCPVRVTPPRELLFERVIG